MGLVFLVIFQFAAVITFQFFCQLPFEWIYFPRRSEDDRASREKMEMLLFLFCIMLGVCMGSLTLLLLGYQLIENPFLNFLNLFITPFIVGRTLCWLHQRRVHLKDRIYLFDSVWNAYIFAFCITVMRYLLI